VRGACPGFLQELQTRINQLFGVVKAQAVGKSVRVEHFKDDAAVMLIIIHQAEQIHHRWADIGVVREEISGLGYADPSHAGANHTDESSGDLGLNVTVIPREACANKRRRKFAGGEEKVRITEKGKGWAAIRVRRGTHMQKLLTYFINNRPLQTRADTELRRDRRCVPRQGWTLRGCRMVAQYVFRQASRD
jgi:hypothetical protein